MWEKGEYMKPVLLKAGIPLALTLAGFIFSIVIRRKAISPRQQEYGSALKELQKALELETAHIELLGMKVKAMGAENQMLEAMVAEYPRVIEALVSAKLEVELLQGRTKKLSKRNREGVHVLHRYVSVLKATEAEISSKNEELQRREGEIRELKDVISELRRTVDRLEEEKKGLMEKLELRENLASSTSKYASVPTQAEKMGERERKAEKYMRRGHQEKCSRVCFALHGDMEDTNSCSPAKPCIGVGRDSAT